MVCVLELIRFGLGSGVVVDCVGGWLLWWLCCIWVWGGILFGGAALLGFACLVCLRWLFYYCAVVPVVVLGLLLIVRLRAFCLATWD